MLESHAFTPVSYGVSERVPSVHGGGRDKSLAAKGDERMVMTIRPDWTHRELMAGAATLPLVIRVLDLQPRKAAA